MLAVESCPPPLIPVAVQCSGVIAPTCGQIPATLSCIYRRPYSLIAISLRNTHHVFRQRPRIALYWGGRRATEHEIAISTTRTPNYFAVRVLERETPPFYIGC
jgi:hypothetical protein